MRVIRTGHFFDEKHPDLYRNWVLGDFIKDPNFKSENFEVKFQKSEKGSSRFPKEVMNPNTRNLAILSYGSVRIKFVNEQNDIFIKEPGDYIYWTPDSPHEFEFLEDSLVIRLRWKI